MTLAGRTLGDFTLRSIVDEGGFGVVYQAEQPSLGRDAIVKVLHARHGSDDRVVQRFLREAKIASRLDHPYAAHIYAFGAETDGVLWIAMERVHGATLRNVIDSQPGGRLSLARLVPLLDALCEVVQTAHDQGIVHRDLKPENIMVVARAGRLLPKLLDLGIAKLVATDDATEEQGVVGSPYYMAPEQWTPGAPLDGRTDIYALGAIIYEVLAGTRLVAGGDLPALARAHVHGEVPALPADLPPAVEVAVRRALAKQPADRFATAIELAAAVREAAGLRLGTEVVPRLDDTLRAELAWLPQPIADAIGALEAAHSPHQARDAIDELVHTIARWLGVLALAARTRTGPRDGDPVAQLRALYEREPSDDGWLELVRALTRPFATIREAYPVPELVDFAALEPSPLAPLIALPAIATEAGLREQLARSLPQLEAALRSIAFLDNYQLVVARGDRADVWMGPRRTVRPVIARARELVTGEAALVDLDGAPVLQLAPLVQIAPPAPGAEPALFVFAGAGRLRGHGARLLAQPHGFERHDEAVWDWFRAQLLPLDEAAAPLDEERPYRGLDSFTEADADRFYGRERAAEAFVNQLLIKRMLVVVGPSGAGKSSFVRAGVLPALPAGWRSVVLRPGPTPMSRLAAVPREPEATTVVVVDQLEELFTQCRDAAERDGFAAALAELALDPTERYRVVLAVRDDFLARTGELAAVRDLIAPAIVLLPTPDDADLLRIVTEPARRAGYGFDDAELPREMVRAVAGQPGALALLSFTGARLWELRDRHFRRLTRKAYGAIGGVEGALAGHAEDTLRGYQADEQRLVREAFRHLATAEGTRAVLSQDELADVLGRTPAATAVIERLIGARLLVATDEGRIEVIHEALLSAWPRLVAWRRADADGARLRDLLHAAARPWHERGRPRGLLWRDEALEDYVRWRARWSGALPEVDQAFGDASVRDARRGRRIRRGLAATAAIVLLAGVIALGLLYRSSRDNATAARDELVQSFVQQGRRFLVDGDYLRALPYLAAAYRAGDDTPALHFMLHRAMQLADAPVLRTEHRGRVGALRPGGTTVLWVGQAGDAAIWDLATGRLGATLAAVPGPVPDGGLLSAVTADGKLAAIPRRDGVALWDGTATRVLPVAAADVVAFDRDGAHLAVAAPHELSVWDVATATRRWSAPLAAGTNHLAWSGDVVLGIGKDHKAWRASAGEVADLGAARRFAVAASGTFVTIAEGKIAIHDATGAVVRTVDVAGVLRGAISDDGKRFALTNDSAAVELHDVATGRVTGLLVGHTGHVVEIGFTPDGKHVITSGSDQTVRIWDAASHGELARFVGMSSAPWSLRVSADGRRVVVVTNDSSHVFPLADPAGAFAIDAGEAIGASHLVGDRIFTTSETGVELWDGKTGARIVRHAVNVSDGAAASPDAALAAIPIADSPTVELRALADGALRATLTSMAPVGTAAFSPDGTRIVTANQAGLVELWDRTGTRVATFRGHTASVLAATFSADGTRVASASSDGTARVWDAATGRELAQLHHSDEVLVAQFSRDGTRLLTASADGHARLWDIATQALVRDLVDTSEVISAAIADEGAEAVTGSRDGTVHVWDVTAGLELARFRQGQQVSTVALAGARLLTTSWDHHAVVWDLGRDIGTIETVTRFVRCHVPYELRDTQLIAAVPGC